MIDMNRFDLSQITVTDVAEVFTCTHIKGGTMQMINRPTCGITLAISGRIVYRHSSGNYISDPQHVVFLPKGMTYSLCCLDTGRFTVMNFDVLKAPDSFASIQIYDLPGLLKIQNAVECLRISEPFERLSAISQIYSMLAKTSVLSGNLSLPSPLKRAIDYIAQNYRNPSLTVKQISDEAGISEIYLRKLFKKCQNISPSHYIRSCRIRHAMNLLTGGGDSIGSIAEDCGYPDISSFSKIFKHEIGCTPSEYRRNSGNVKKTAA